MCASELSHNADDVAVSWQLLRDLPVRTLVNMHCPACGYDIGAHAAGELTGCMEPALIDGQADA